MIYWVKQQKHTTMQLYKKEDFPLKGRYRAENIIYKCVVSTPADPDKAYL